MKTYNSTNFFKHTYCEFLQVDNFEFPENTNYKSKSESQYFYTNKGVYRKSNHWGRVANCRWKLIANENYKNQQEVIGFANWSDFYPINSLEKNFTIKVDFERNIAKITPKEKSTIELLSFSEAQKKTKKIRQLLKNNNWLKYYEGDIMLIRKKIISEYITSNKSLQEIKKNYYS